MADPRPPGLTLSETDGSVRLTLAGAWVRGEALPDTDPVFQALRSGRVTRVAADASGVTEWDSMLVALLDRVGRTCGPAGIRCDWAGLPDGLRRILALAAAVPEKTDAHRVAARPGLLERLGQTTLRGRDQAESAVTFVGEVLIGLWAMLRGRARFQARDLWLLIQQAGADALGVVTLINVLIGMILAFVGASQLQRYGASIYVADLVAIAVVRDMAAIMTAIVMAGRSGASYAAALGTMNSNQEIDALRTLGISPMEFLVVPRVVALTLMLPLLVLYADVVGILGGAFVAGTMLGTSPTLYFEKTWTSLTLSHLAGGLFKATTYGMLVGLAGTYQGIRAGRSAAGVGDATTRAVVDAIVLIIVAAGIYAVLFYAIGW